MYKINEIRNSFLLAGDKFVPEIHLKQPGFTYSPCGPITKNKEKIKGTGDSRYIYQNELDKVCFQHDIAYGGFKRWNKGKAFNIVKNPKYDRYQHGIASLIYKLFDKKTFGGTVKSQIISNKELAQELHKPIVRKF